MLKGIILKQVCVLGGLLGLVLGLITIIPLINGLSFLALMLFAAPVVLVYMKKLEMIGILDIKQGCIYGAIIGFVSFIGFSISFLPLATILALIFKGTFYSGIKVLFTSGVFVLVTMVLFVAILSALFNGFSGAITTYIYSQIESKPNDSSTNIDIQE